MDAKNGNRVREPQRRIMILDRGRLLRKHAGGLGYYDSRHRVYQAPLGGSFVKAGKRDVAADILAYAQTLIDGSIKIMDQRSSNIANVVKGELKIEGLK